MQSNIEFFKELPFNDCFQENFTYQTNTRMHSNGRHPNYPHVYSKFLFQELPFKGCNDQEIVTNCLSSKEHFFKLLEDNNIKSLFSNIFNYDFNCKYQNKNSFLNTLNSHSSTALKVFHINIRSLNKHKLILKLYFESLKCKFDIIFITETGNASKSEIEHVFQDYEFFIDTPTPGKGSKGGAGILVNKNSFNEIEEIYENKNESLKDNCICTNCKIENKWLKLKCNDASYIVASVYRHPNGNIKHFVDGLQKLFAKVDKKSTLIFGGDMNIDLIKHQNSNVNLYIETLLEHNIIPYINIPTRITSYSATLIDHINVRLPINQINKKISSGNLNDANISDHLPNYVIIDDNIRKTNERPLIRLYNKKNIENFHKNISNEPMLLPFPRSNDPNQLLAEFTYNLNKILNKYFPLIRISRKKYKDKVHITNEIKEMIKERNKLYDIFIIDRLEHNKVKWLEKRNKTNQAIRNAEINHYKDEIKQHGDNCQAMWKTLSHIISRNKKKSPSINSLKVGQRNLTNQLDILEGLNSFFCNVGETLANQFGEFNEDYKLFFNQPANRTIYLYKIIESELASFIKKLDSKKSSGHDGFTAKFLKISSLIVNEPLSYIFNLSINTGSYPDELKIAKCIPIFKKGKRNDPSNYRPISILSIINKLFEKLIYKRLYKYLTKFNILYDYQYGFRQKHSTTQALIEITDYLKTTIDKKKYICGIFLDLTKAFDTVNHAILLDKLHNYGIRGKAHKLLKSYLTNRYQYVALGNLQSNKQPINCGVPQGSVLGPLLFLLYINDIVNCCNLGKIRIFADDTSDFVDGENINEVISKAEISMNNLSKWFKANRLTLSTEKSSFIIFRSQKSKLNPIPSEIKFGQNSISRGTSVKYLGVTIDEHLTWNEHVETVSNNLKKCFSTFYGVRDYISKDQIKNIYYSLIYSKITYALPIYGLTSKENLLTLQRMQNKLLKVLMKKNYRYPTNQLHNELEILKVEDLVDQEILTFVSNFKNSKLPKIFDSYFEFRGIRQQIRTRNIENKLIVPNTNTNYGEQTVKVRGAKLWNQLPNTLTDLINPKRFRKIWKNCNIPYPTT